MQSAALNSKGQKKIGVHKEYNRNTVLSNRD